MALRSRQSVRPAVPCPGDVTDLGLVHSMAAGDTQAFETLYRRYARRLAAYLSRLLGSPAAVDEVLDDTLLAVWQQASAYRPTGRVSSWIFGIARHKALKARAAAARWAPRDCTAQQAEPDEATPEAHLRQQEDTRAIRAALAALRPEQREVVELTYYHQCSYQEIAARLGCPENTVKTRMWQARRHLAARLACQGWGGLGYASRRKPVCRRTPA